MRASRAGSSRWDRVAARQQRRVLHVVAGQKGEQLFDLLDAVGVGLAGEVGHAALGVVGHGAAQVLEADLFAGDALDDVRAGDEHIGGILHHEDEVRHGRRIDRTAGGGAHDGRNLRDDAAGDGVPIEDLAVAAKRIHPFLDAGPAGVVEAHQRHPGLQGQVHDLADLLGVHLAQRPGAAR